MILNFHRRDDQMGFYSPAIPCPKCGFTRGRIIAVEDVKGGSHDGARKVSIRFRCGLEGGGHEWTLVIEQADDHGKNKLKVGIENVSKFD